MALCDTRINKLLCCVGPGAAKSTVTSQDFCAWLIGQTGGVATNLVVSAGEDLPSRWQDTVKRYIEVKEGAYRRIFPSIEPDMDSGFGTRGLYVTGHQVGSPDPNFLATGMNSRLITGVHANGLIVCDDLHTEENSRSAELCEQVIDKFYKTILGRAAPSGCRYVVTGRRFSEYDILGHLMSAGDFVSMVLPAERNPTEGLYWEVTVPDGIECCFSDGKIAQPDGTLIDVGGSFGWSEAVA